MISSTGPFSHRNANRNSWPVRKTRAHQPKSAGRSSRAASRKSWSQLQDHQWCVFHGSCLCGASTQLPARATNLRLVLSVHPQSVHPSVFPLVPFVGPELEPRPSSFGPPTNLPLSHQWGHLFSGQPIYLTIHPSIHPSTYPSINLSNIHPFNQSINPSITHWSIAPWLRSILPLIHNPNRFLLTSQEKCRVQASECHAAAGDDIQKQMRCRKAFFACLRG